MPKPLDDEIKCRVPAELKERLLALAEARELKLAVILREALRAYVSEAPTEPRNQNEVAA